MSAKNIIIATLGVILLGLVQCKSFKRSKMIQESMSSHTIHWDGYERKFLQHLPPREKMNKPMPILFHLHGGGGTAKGTAGFTYGRFNELSDKDGFIVVYPDAIKKHWNDGRTSDIETSWKDNIDDVGFIVSIIDTLKKQYNIDTTRIFTVGMSNGGFMSSRLICDKANLFRGAAILTATISVDYLPKCRPSKGTAVMVINGTADPLVPYNGGQIKVLKKDRGAIISTDSFIHYWQKINHCKTHFVRKLKDTKDDGTSVTIKEFGGCTKGASLVLYTIENGGHTWPQGKQYLGERIIGKTSQEFNACDVIWDYFKNLKP